MGIYNSLLGKGRRAVSGKTPFPAVREFREQNREPENISAQALAALKAHVMIADTNNVITSINPSVEAMLREAQDDIRKELPGFNVDTLVGSTMDVFHRNPAHQRDLLAGLNRPFETTIAIGGRKFSLRATPLFDDGRRSGTVVEWQDNTETFRVRELERQLQQEQEARSRQLGIIKAGLDTVSTNVMLADADGTIIYANPAVLRTLKEAEPDLRAALGNFSADRIVGSNFDVFHRNPAHQRDLLSRLAGPHEANISIGVRRFRLNAAPVFDERNQRLGTVVEWRDRTAEMKMEDEVDAAINGAIMGDLSQRIDHAGYSGFLARIGQGINRLMDIFDKVLGDTETSLNALAQGDLCRRIETDYEGRYQSLKTYINSTIDQLNSVVREINGSTDSVKQASHEISMGNLNLSQRTEEQAASLEQTSSAMIEITHTVEENSKSAVLARQLSSEARDSAETGGRVVGQAILAMDGISDSSAKIDEIISVIDDIAFQTNLLALNAAVEAARAGNQGRGFAVVADEVRNLASRSATAAKEIKVLIKESGSRVQEGSRLVSQSGETLDQIIQAVKKVNDVISEISVNSEEQARSLAEISKAVESMDDMTQQNAALVEEAAAASESLHGQAEGLAELISFFRTRDS